MGKRETKQTYNDTKSANATAQANYQTARDDSASALAPLNSNSTALRGDLMGGYQNVGSAGTLTPGTMNAPRAIDSSELSNTLNSVRNIGPAFSDSQIASIGGNVSGLKNIGNLGATSEEGLARARGGGGFEQLLNNGGLDATAMARMRGNGGFDEFATTGGYSSSDLANIKSQAISPIGSMASGTRDELARRVALTGGYAPGFDAANRQLRRDTSKGISDASLSANVMLKDRINAGRQFGISGLTGAEQNLQGLRTGNIATGATGLAQTENAITNNALGGLNSASQVEMGLQDRINQYKLAGLSQEAAIARSMADIDSQNVGNAMGSEEFNIGNAGSAQQFNIQNTQGQQALGLGGLQSIYNSDVGQAQNERDRANALLGGQTQSNLSYLGNQGQLAVQPGIGGTILNGITSGAGAIAPMFSPAGIFAKTGKRIA